MSLHTAEIQTWQVSHILRQCSAQEFLGCLRKNNFKMPSIGANLHAEQTERKCDYDHGSTIAEGPF